MATVAPSQAAPCAALETTKQRGHSRGLILRLSLMPAAALTLVLFLSAALVGGTFYYINDRAHQQQVETFHDMLELAFAAQMQELKRVTMLLAMDDALFDAWFAARVDDESSAEYYLDKLRAQADVDEAIFLDGEGKIIARSGEHDFPAALLRATAHDIWRTPSLGAANRDSAIAKLVSGQTRLTEHGVMQIAVGPVLDAETVVGAVALLRHVDQKVLQRQREMLGPQFHFTLADSKGVIVTTATGLAFPDLGKGDLERENVIGGRSFHHDFEPVNDGEFYRGVGYDVTDQQRLFMLVLVILGTTFATSIAVVTGITMLGARRVVQLKDAVVNALSEGVPREIAVSGKDELGVLAQAFNEMVCALSRTTVSKVHLDEILESMLDCVIVADAEGRITRVNRATPRMLGYQESDLIGQPVGMVIDDDFLPGFRAADFPETGIEANAETTYRTRDGRALPVLFSVGQLRDEHGKPQGLVFAAQDISERKAMEQRLLEKTAELKHSNAELNQFAYITSHDLKAPLRAISNLSQWIEEDLRDKLDGDTCKQFELLRGRVQRMENLINGLLEYSRIGRVKADIETVDVAKLLAEIIDSMPQPPGYRIEVGERMPVMQCARLHLSQVLANLISNSIKYRSRDDGHTEVGVVEHPGHYEFSVQDDGIGIAAAYHEKIFGIFQTLAARDKVESTGIGLSIVKKIIEEQGGTITLESEEGRGATFRFTWPKHEERKIS